jgi:serine/threonine protein kinase
MGTNIKTVDDQLQEETPSIATPADGSVSQRYRILTKIGSGGMGDVFLGIQHGAVDFQRLIVVKQIHAYLFNQPDHQQMFVDEASLVASLDHPHIVKIIDFRQTSSSFFIVMEYVDGETLKVLRSISQKNRIAIPFPLGCKLVLAACEALQYAHEATSRNGKPLNIIHRDIGLHNLMIDRNGYLKVIDFGIAKSDMQTDVTHPGLLKGNPNYMAPDLFLCEKIDRRVDIYALGLCLYELLTKQRAFIFDKKAELAEIIQQITQRELEPPSSIEPSVPPELDEIVARAVAKKRDHRYSSVIQMADDLRDVARRYPNEFAKVDIKQWFYNNFSARIQQRIQFEKNVLENAVNSTNLRSASIYSYAPPPNVATGQMVQSGTSVQQAGGIVFVPRIILIGGFLMFSIISAILVYSLFYRAPTPISSSSVEEEPNLFVRTKPAGADVYVDGKRVGTTDEWGSSLRISPEKQHVVQVSKEGFADYRISVILSENEERRLNADLEPKKTATAAEPEPSELEVESEDDTPEKQARGRGFDRRVWKRRSKSPEHPTPPSQPPTPPAAQSAAPAAEPAESKPQPKAKPSIPLLEERPKKVEVPLLEKKKSSGSVPLI